MMDKIFVNEMSFYGYHGVFEEEKKLGQRFLVDLTLMLDLKEAGKTDDVTRTIDYSDVYERVKKIVEETRYALIEALAERISEELFCAYDRLKACVVKVTKPNPPIAGSLRSVAVEILRERP